MMRNTWFIIFVALKAPVIATSITTRYTLYEDDFENCSGVSRGSSGFVFETMVCNGEPRWPAHSGTAELVDVEIGNSSKTTKALKFQEITEVRINDLPTFGYQDVRVHLDALLVGEARSAQHITCSFNARLTPSVLFSDTDFYPNRFNPNDKIDRERFSYHQFVPLGIVADSVPTFSIKFESPVFGAHLLIDNIRIDARRIATFRPTAEDSISPTDLPNGLKKNEVFDARILAGSLGAAGGLATLSIAVKMLLHCSKRRSNSGGQNNDTSTTHQSDGSEGRNALFKTLYFPKKRLNNYKPAADVKPNTMYLRKFWKGIDSSRPKEKSMFRPSTLYLNNFRSASKRRGRNLEEEVDEGKAKSLTNELAELL